MDFRRIAIVNRGEPAMRLINAVSEYNLEQDTSIRTIALFTAPDRRAMFVREADEAYDLGPATYVDEADQRRKVSYLDHTRLERALVETDADAAWVGWGFVAEDAAFADLCRRLGVVFIGPDGDVMRRIGDKITSKRLATDADVRVVPWSGGPVAGEAETRAKAEELGYPLMIKATAGGGGRGIRRVGAPNELAPALAAATAEALGAFGDGTVYLERLIPEARHIEVQIVADDTGTVWPVGVRDCSVQRRNQKVLEEAPAPTLTADQLEEVMAAAARIGEAAGYRNAGTVEFLFDEKRGVFYFMEVNARLQVEHPITELTTGLDLVKLQLHLAAGGKLEGDPPATAGHAIEARLNAEDPDKRFAPAPGVIEMLRLPAGTGVRIDTGVEEGDRVAPEFDSMIAKIIAYGRDRHEALARLRRVIGQSAVVIRGGASNKAFLQTLLDRHEFRSGNVDVGWIDRLVASGELGSTPYGAVALVAAAIGGYQEATALERDRFRASAARGRPSVEHTRGHDVALEYQGRRYAFHVDHSGPNTYRIKVDGRVITASVAAVGRNEARLTCGGEHHRVLSMVHGITHHIDVNGVPHRISHDEGGVIRAPYPAVVVSVAVQPGDVVAPGDRLAVIEAMKMETSIVAEFPGTVREILVRNNVHVAPGTPLLVVDPAEAPEGTIDAERVNFDELVEPLGGEHRRCRHRLADLRHLLLGYDVDARELSHMIDPGEVRCTETPADGELRDLQKDSLSIFTDIIALFRRHPTEDEDGDDLRRSNEEYFHDYLRDLDPADDGLPEPFLGHLRTVLAHHRVSGLEHTPELDEALFRLTKSHQRMAEQTTPILGVLEAFLEDESHVPDPDFRDLVDRLITESRGRYPAVHNLATEIRYLTFDQPFLEDVRRRAYEEADRHLAALEYDPEGDDRDIHVEALVDCPQPLMPTLSARFTNASPACRRALLEVITRRYYRIRDLEDVSTTERDGFSFAWGAYDHEGKRIRVLSSHTAVDTLPHCVRTMNELLAGIDPEHEAVVDLYVWRDRTMGTADEARQHVQALLDEVLGPNQLRRVVVALSGPGLGRGMGGVVHFTFRPAGNDRYVEQTPYRDLHPMMGKRLEMWRLSNFETRRLTTLEDIYLFHGIAKNNPRDERLFALAEVRDMTPVRDADGRIVRLPEFERMLFDVFGSIRRFQAGRHPNRRLHWNRVLLYVWPDIDLSPAELDSLIARLSPQTEGLGLQKVVIRGRIRAPGWNEPRPAVLEIADPGGRHLSVRLRQGAWTPIRPLTPYKQKVVRLRQRGLMYPYELLRVLAPDTPLTEAGIPRGTFEEHDLVDGALVPVERPPGENEANVVVGVVRSYTDTYPEGMARVIILGDPSRGMGSLAESECRRIIAALDLAERMQVPLEWFAVSAGALISMDSGTENMDWIARVLRRIVTYTQAGGEINIVVAGINVGAQPYWNAEATMLMHTRGILVMAPESSMVLTGKRALDFSGGVSAEDNQGIGGYERIMGPNGQAQYFARDLGDACRILLAHYEHSYVAPGERFPRPAGTTDPVERNIEDYPHGGEFPLVGDVFSETVNPGRKKAFEIRRIMAAAVDQDHPTMERWFGMQHAEVAVVWDAHLGGHPVCLLGFESKPLPRFGFVPADGPDQWTSGTLFPVASKKVARAINAASGNRPVVVLANLSGFDGSPESMRRWQLEYGAEIGRAVVNFQGPIVFCVVSRYHGGAFVVFSNALNEGLEVAAIEGSHASVIGGAPAAAVVFAREVERRIDADPRVAELVEAIADADVADKATLAGRLARLREEVRSEKLGEVASRFDTVHSVQRALEVGSVHRIIRAAELRPYLIDAVARGIQREIERIASDTS